MVDMETKSSSSSVDSVRREVERAGGSYRAGRAAVPVMAARITHARPTSHVYASNATVCRYSVLSDVLLDAILTFTTENRLENDIFVQSRKSTPLMF